MANTILTPTMVTRAALVILHQKLNFVGSINRQYDDSFAIEGAKIGTTLKIRLPAQYTTVTGASLSTQNQVETSTTLTVNTQRHVDTTFTSNELTMSLQDFSDRVLDPAMCALAAGIENDALSMANDIYQTVDNTTNASVTMKEILSAKALLDNALAPNDGRRTANLTPQDQVDLVFTLKGLFQDSTAIKEQYREGFMGRTAGFDFVQNTLIASLTTGTCSAAPNYTVTDTIVPATPQSTINILSNTTPQGTLVVGDVFTIATLNRVHPESKADTGVLQQFVVNIAMAGGVSANSISFAPPIDMSTAGSQNVKNIAISTQLITKVGNTSRVLRQSLLYHRDAFTFATADLIMPKGVHFGAREVQDGISMRIVQQYAISTDTLPCRIDVLYGFKTIRAALAAKVAS